VSAFSQAFGCLNGTADPFKRFVSINKKYAIIRQHVGIRVERIQFALKRHHPTVGVGPFDWNAEELPGEHV